MTLFLNMFNKNAEAKALYLHILYNHPKPGILSGYNNNQRVYFNAISAIC